MTEGALVDFVMPVYNEAANIRTTLADLYAKVPLQKRVVIIYDMEEDDTLQVIRGVVDQYPGLELVRNRFGSGVLNAIRTGIERTTSEVVIITMADLSDDLSIVSEMVERIRSGKADVVCASRYMAGGQQIGGPRLKRFLSRAAGLSLHLLSGLPSHDATNAFRAYRRSMLQSIPIESVGGFEYSLELTVKAHAAGYRITEVPTIWRDREAGTSRFRLLKWLPYYLKWYFYAIGHSLFSRRARRSAAR